MTIINARWGRGWTGDPKDKAETLLLAVIVVLVRSLEVGTGKAGIEFHLAQLN